MQRNFNNRFNRAAVISLFYVLAQVGVNSISLNEDEKFCVNILHLNQSTMEVWNIEPLLPEDNKEIIQFMACYWKRIGYQEENGEFNYLKISEVVHNDLKSRFRSDCLHIVAYVVDSCRTNVNAAESDGLKAIKLWNCLNLYAENLF